MKSINNQLIKLIMKNLISKIIVILGWKLENKKKKIFFFESLFGIFEEKKKGKNHLKICEMIEMNLWNLGLME